jgi:ankyrin repeat protein
MTSSKDFATAIETGDIATVKHMLAQQPELANATDWRPSPLHCAVLWNRPQIAEILLESGADIESRDPDRQTTPLRYAILYGKKEMIPMLLAHGANAGAIREHGTTAMELAVEAAKGAFEQYDDLPSSTVYAEIVSVLQQNGVE